jgi:hypothetical protein
MRSYSNVPGVAHPALGGWAIEASGRIYDAVREACAEQGFDLAADSLRLLH